MPSDNVTDAIDNLTAAVLAGDLILGLAAVFMLVAILTIPAVWLTTTMFRSRDMLLGFPSAIFWALLGGCFYLVPTTINPAPDITWTVTWWRLVSFACFGMAIFCMYAMYALRRKDLDPPDADDKPFIDEKPEPDVRGDVEIKESRVSKRSQGVRDRAAKRRRGY